MSQQEFFRAGWPFFGENSDQEEAPSGIGVGPPVPGATEGIWDALGGEGGDLCPAGFVGSSQGEELLWDEGEEEELRLLALGLAELSPAALVALVTSGSAWLWLWDVWNLPGTGSRAGIPKPAQDFALCPNSTSALGILGKLRGFLAPR